MLTAAFEFPAIDFTILNSNTFVLGPGGTATRFTFPSVDINQALINAGQITDAVLGQTTAVSVVINEPGAEIGTSI